MKNRRFVVLILVLIVTLPTFSQSDDFGIWYGLNTEYSVKKKLEIDLSAMIRTFNNASDIDEAFLEGGVTYKLNKYLALAGSYRITENLEDNSEYHIRHKLMADIKGNGSLGRFDFSARFRFQRQDKTYFEDANDEIPDYHGRIKIKAEYKTPSFPINPSISFETFYRMFEATEKRFDKHRFAIGIEYKINKKHSLELEYMFERDYFPKLSDINLIVLSYKFKL
ncbi:MAG TPA: DUF2490 domain-containing protein [Bacteroidales bacterium]|nr:DUF2490 domain-containing protein [Bacteroidales bacterium]